MKNQPVVCFIIFGILLFISIPSIVLAHDGGHRGCYAGGSGDCPSGHSASQPFPNNCPWTDPECATRAVDGCDIRNLDALNFPGGNFPNGIDVCASNRIVDCANNQLTGSRGFLSVGITIRSANNVIIRNCRIANYDTGARTWQSYSGGEFRGNTFLNNRMNDIFLQPPASRVNIYENNFRNSDPSVTLYSSVTVSSSNRINITRNTFLLSSNALVGVGLSYSSNNLVEKNSFSGGALAILTSSLLSPADNNIINENTISNVPNFGGIVIDGNYNNITKNVITGGGISIGGMFAPGNYNLIEGNNITGGSIGLFGVLGLPPSNNNVIRTNAIKNGGGISIGYANNNIVDHNTITNSGIVGISLSSANANNITKNIINGSALGIAVGDMFGSTTNNYLFFNTIIKASSSGVFFWNAERNTALNNTILNSTLGILIQDSANNFIKTNRFINNSVALRLLNARDTVIDANLVIKGGIDAFNSNFNNITRNNITEGGIALRAGSTRNNIFLNTIHRGQVGVELDGSHMNRVQNNSISNNALYGVSLLDAGNNTIDVNYVCQNSLSDFYVSNSIGNNGTRNTCDRPDGWNDIGAFGCTYRCLIFSPAGSLDFGDAPDPPYPSLLRSNGARHSDIGYEMLGTRVSADLDAKVPDRDEFDDGIAFPILRPFSNVTINITVTIFDKSSPWYRNPLFLSGWFDWNNDGGWSTNEKAFSIRLNASTFQNNTVIIPVTFTTPQINRNTTWARIRLSYRTEANVTGEVLYGEVEDYVVNVSSEPLLILQGLPRIGTTMNLSIDDPLHPNASYVLGMSLGTIPGIQLNDGRVIPLNFDIILFLSLQIPQSVGLSNNIGTLNSQGKAVATWSIPNVNGLVGNTFYFAFITLVQTSPPIASISRSVNVTVLP